jgi:hypothetical protein
MFPEQSLRSSFNLDDPILVRQQLPLHDIHTNDSLPFRPAVCRFCQMGQSPGVSYRQNQELVCVGWFLAIPPRSLVFTRVAGHLTDLGKRPVKLTAAGLEPTVICRLTLQSRAKL